MMRCLVIGLGSIGQRHVRNLRALCGDAVDIIAYRVRRDTPLLTDTFQVIAAESVEDRYGIRTFFDLNLALAEKPDFALVCNPSNLHVSVAQALAAANCHFLIEKPLSDSLDGIDGLIGSCEREGLVALVGYQWRFHPLLARVRSLLVEGALGHLVSVQAEAGEYLPGWHPYEDYRRMYAARREQGGGVILSQIHELDYLYWLFGAPRRVVAMGGTRSRLDIDVEDTVAILMDMGGMPVQVYEDYLQRPARRVLRIVGDHGVIDADLLAPRLTVFKEGMLVEEAMFEGFTRNQLFLDEMRHFLDCVAGRAKPLVTLRDGAVSLRMALAARNSLETGRIVTNLLAG
jgi:predicted dehydrogenase